MTHRDLDFWGKNQGNMHKLGNSVLHEEREKKTETVSKLAFNLHDGMLQSRRKLLHNTIPFSFYSILGDPLFILWKLSKPRGTLHLALTYSFRISSRRK